MKLQKRTVLITGGTSGIGLELAKQLQQRGNTVIVTGRDQEKLDTARSALAGVHVFKSDVSDPGAIAALRDAVLNQFPTLDTLVNNAGIMRNLNLNQDRDLNDVTREIEINLSGPVRMVQQFLPHLKSRKGALIVNVSSGLAFIPMPISPVYCATKAAIHSFTQSLRVQLAGTGVTVIELAPPGVETPLFRGEFADELRGQKGMDVKILVGKAIAGIEAGRLEIRPGLSNVLKVMSRIAPQFMFNQMVKMAKPKKVTPPTTKRVWSRS
ncbi:MAG: SDR family NAD(P)-dependent oxidoreductase [Pseudomonadota bacterium]|nr:SDR family NAD(P)-dependent oxidoreductase [Pseudomonadota bacterium]